MKPKRDKPKPKPMWSGRLSGDLDRRVLRFTGSLHLDRRLALFDLQGSRVHVEMLARQGLLSGEDRDAILKGLSQIEEEIRAGSFPYREELEDIHMNIEARLQELVGEAGARLHTGRSRNDQVALDLKLFCLEEASAWRRLLADNLRVLLGRAEREADWIFPAWTHLQVAQPLSWGHYWLAFCAMLGRDVDRLEDYRRRHAVSPLGAGALSGSSLPLDPDWSAGQLGLQASFLNSYDVVGDRDFLLELVQIGVQIMIHLSRLAQDLIFLCSSPVGWVELPDAFCTGSSMMPQKKNPDVLELVRGRCALVIGCQQSLATLLKGLYSSYHRDLQLDKEALFAACDHVNQSLEMMAPLVAGLRVQEETCRRAAEEGFLLATEVAEYLVVKGVPFRQAYQRVGRLVQHCLEVGRSLQELSQEEVRRFLPEVGSDLAQLLSPEAVLQRRRHVGSSGKEPIRRQLQHWKKWLQNHFPESPSP